MPHTEASMIELLHKRYDTRSQGLGHRYVAMAHVRNDAGFDAQRTADFMAMDLWPSKGLVLHGHEVKISRSDWLTELKDPEKAGAFIPHVDYWWLVIADRDMVKPGELPEGWGLMAPGGDGMLRVFKQAPRLTEPRMVRHELHGRSVPDKEAGKIQRGLAVGMLRSASKTANRLAQTKQGAELAELRDYHKRLAREEAAAEIRAKALLDAANALEAMGPQLKVQYVAALRLFATDPWRLPDA